ncbi:hypothetical protein RND71_029046 [Anisodus tanguticus]|uniref:Uncharacterized protein n=1 Tax=Anisodus tanguticus TaxID=243964 RepID=A0AAE1UYF0_9SOLA|nr:hypothetical protein RND71_029046 [Anisodus tanguticus]
MDPSKKLLRSGSSSNKIRQIVRLQQLLKKWKKIAAASPSSTHLQLNSVPFVANNTSTSTASTNNSSSINKFLKKTLSFSEKDKDRSDDGAVPKGCLAVCVGKEDKEELMKRFVIPMDYLTHQSFQVLLREAEEEFGFQQQGVLKIPCEVSIFEKILKIIHPPASTSTSNKKQQPPADDNNIIHNVGCCSPENHQHIMSPQLCS